MDFYVILGIEKGATLADVKRAYKRLARRYHPDINPGDRMAAAQFRQIAEAYETLSDPDRRRHYDQSGATPATSAAEGAFGFDGFDFSVSVSGADAPTFGDLFAEVFQPRGARPADDSSQGADLHGTIELSFEEALAGGQRELTITRQEHCRTCRGTGRLHAAETRCGTCQGSGIVKSARGHMVFSKPCPHCAGSGRLRHTTCPSCGGAQVAMQSETIAVNIPPGLGDGSRVRVPSKGHAGPNGSGPGDLYITVRVRPHPIFRREGDDVLVTVPIAIHEAALGARIEVPAPDGSARLRVPPGTQSGQRFHVRGRGVPSRGGGRGDLIVEVRLVLPRVLDERSKELLREFGKINNADVRAS